MKLIKPISVNMLNNFTCWLTTVRDLGGTGVNVSLRNTINSGDVIGRFILQKSLGTTGGHADPTNGSNRKLMGNPGAGSYQFC